MPSLNTGNAILSNAIAVNSSYNVGIGGAASGSLKLQVTGSDILVNGLTIGEGAGSIGSNTVVGASALPVNTTGTFNTAIGNSALLTNTTGYGNTSVGYSAIGYNTTGFFNAGVGVNALLSNTTGTYNNALGTAALYANTTGSYNTAVGQQAGTANTTGSNNTYIGYSSGLNITTGSNNTIIGNFAGTSALANNIVLADGAGNVRYQWNGTNNAFTGAATFSSFVGINGSPATAFPLEAYINSSTAYTTSSRGNVMRVYNSNSGSNVFAGIELGGAGPSNDGLAGLNAVVTSAGSAALTFYTRDSNTFAEKMRITSGGNVGIGTSSPDNIASQLSTLSLGGTNPSISGGISYQVNGSVKMYQYVDSDGLFIHQALSGVGQKFFTNNTERMRIGSDGRVFIGIAGSSNGHKLEINSGATSAIRVDVTSGTSGFSMSPGAVFGIDKPGVGGGTFQITSGGCVAINNPTDKSQPLSVQGFLGNWTAFFQASTTGSNSLGPLVYAGTNSNDWCMYSASAVGTPYFRVRGDGATFVAGSLSKGSGSFRIDHPLESMSETHELVHSFIEGPQADLIYRGKLTLVNGKAQANIDEVSTMTNGTFEALCREVQCFTTNESGWDLVKGKVIGNIIYIESQNVNSTDEISWMVIGERKDKHMIDTGWTDENGKVIVEPLKINEPENLPNNNKQ